MNKAKYLLDSVILIDHLSGRPKASEWLLKLGQDEALISVITRAEVLSGAKDSDDENRLYLLLETFKCLSIDSRIADQAAKLRIAHGLTLPDALQAAVAKHWDLTLVTRNTKDFKGKWCDFVLVPYQ